jgi:hypothetical protein
MNNSRLAPLKSNVFVYLMIPFWQVLLLLGLNAQPGLSSSRGSNSFRLKPAKINIFSSQISMKY